MSIKPFIKQFSLFSLSSNRILGMNRRNIDYVHAKNPREHFSFADDKLKTKSVFSSAGIPVAETLCTFSSFYSLSDLKEKLHGYSEFVVKPARGSKGLGILVIVQVDGDYYMTAGGHWLHYDELHRHVADIVFGVYAHDKPDTAIIERLIHAHPFFKALYPKGLSDIRVIVVNSNPVMCMARVPTNDSDGKANLHRGALGLGIDISSGTIFRAWHKKQSIKTHPDTGINLIGEKIPEFDKIIEIAKSAGRVLPLGYIGVDVVIDERSGPLILEVNARPGLEIQNVCGMGLREAFIKANLGDT